MIKKIIGYLKKLFQQWTIYIGFALTIVEIISKIIGKDIDIAFPVVLTGYLVGLLISGLIVYIKLLNSIPEEYLPDKPIVKNELIEGNSYSYKFIENEDLNSESSDINVKYSMMNIKDSKLPVGLLKVNGRLINLSNHSIRITSIAGQIDGNGIYDMMLPKINIDGAKAKFPITIKSKDILLFQYIINMYPITYYTEAQVAVRSSNDENNNTILNSTVETVYGNNETFEHKSTFKISMKPFSTKLHQYWVKLGAEDILSLINKE